MIKLYIKNKPTLTFKMSYLLLNVYVKCQPLKYTKFDISIYCLHVVSLEMTINLQGIILSIIYWYLFPYKPDFVTYYKGYARNSHLL